jgi:hypothetical protein
LKNAAPDISVKKLVMAKLATPSVLALLIIFIFSFSTIKYWINWQQHPFDNDVNQYYSYLVAQFIHHDFSFKFDHNFWLIETPTHQLVPKVTMGMAILYLPFFIIGNNIAFTFDFDGLGYSSPYAWSIHIGTIIYVLIGFWYTRKMLLLFFNEWITAITILLLLFGTNLFYYTYREGEMTHSYLFFLISIFIYHSIKWYSLQKIKHFYILCFVAGFITLIRPTEIIILIIPLLYKVSNFKTLKLRVIELLSLKWKLALAILFFILPIIPQLIFWKVHTGQFLFFSYGSTEGFFFSDPKFYSVLFGWHKGWFTYTPLALFMILGLILMIIKKEHIAIAISVYLLINIYLISCWWDWGFGGAFGMRALVQSYALLAIPLAYFIKTIYSISQKSIKRITIFISSLAFIFIISLNIFQMRQFKIYVYHWDGMTKEAYQYTFFRLHFGRIDRAYLETLYKFPDYDAMRKGKRDE